MGIDQDANKALATQPIDPPASAVTLFGSNKPAEVIKAAGEVAEALRDVLIKQNLTVLIRDRRHVLVDGWTLAGTLLGVFPVPVWTRPLTEEIDGKKSFLGWEARVEARTRAGEVVGAAEAECRFSESRWTDADSYAVRSMAQTRATSKAMRLPLGFIISLAGYEGTPAEEMPQDAPPPRRPAPQAKPLPKPDAVSREQQERDFEDAFDSGAGTGPARKTTPPVPDEHKAQFALYLDALGKAKSKKDAENVFIDAEAKGFPKELRARLHKHAGVLAAQRKRQEELARQGAAGEPGSRG